MMPLHSYILCMNIEEDRDETELITSYFQQGFTKLEILEFLKLHGIQSSLSTLKQRLRCLGLRQRVPQDTVELIIEQELAGSKCNVGYRAMWKHVVSEYGIAVQREVVRKLLVKLDPEGVESRAKRRLRRWAYSAKGPNFI